MIEEANSDSTKSNSTKSDSKWEEINTRDIEQNYLKKISQMKNFRWRNWAGNQESLVTFFQPSNLEELRCILNVIKLLSFFKIDMTLLSMLETVV